ncbi:hypothetical protein ACHQM5_016277 [Ranunculus cassubicifolius]
MKRAKEILTSFRLVELFPINRTSTFRSLHSQVIPSSYISSLLFSPSLSYYKSNFLNTQQKSHFSSKPSTSIALITTSEWSESIEKELEDSHLTLTHETVLYVLKNLERNPKKAFYFFNWVTNKHGFNPSIVVYDLILRILCNKETMKEFRVLIKKMSDQGCYIDKETYLAIFTNLKNLKLMEDAAMFTEFFKKTSDESSTDSLVTCIVKLLRSNSDFSSAVKEKMGELKDFLSENTILGILRGLRQYPLKALSFFRWVEEEMVFTHNAVTYNGVLRLLGEKEFIEVFWSVVKELKGRGHDIDIFTYTKLSRHFEKNKMMKDAVELYEVMLDSPYKPSVENLCSLLRYIASTDTPDFSLVFGVFTKFEATTGDRLPKAVYDGIHRCFASAGRFDEAGKIMEMMKNLGYEPDNVTYSQIVFGLCKSGRLQEACKMLDQMEAEGCVPDIKTWTTLLQGHCTAGEIDQAFHCFNKMLDKNIKADEYILEVLVNGLCTNRRTDSAYNVVIDMEDKANLKPWRATYKTLIYRLLGERKLQQAINLLHLQKKHNYPPFPEQFVTHISKFGTTDDAIEFLTTFSVKQNPSPLAYFHVFQSFFKEGRQQEARDLLYKCPHHIRNHADILDLFASLSL